MDVDLALVAESACQNLGVHVKFMGIPAQALEQVIKCKMTYIFIAGHQGWEFLPVHEILGQPQPDWNNNLNTQKKMTSYVFS